VLSGKVLIDCNNRVIGKGRDRAGHPAASHAEMLAADVPGARVVKAFNTIAHRVIELSRAQLAPHRVSVFLCSDDSEAKGTVKTLAEELGFVGMDCGTLQDARLVETLFEFVSFQIGAMALGPFATVSVHVVAERD
jgi:predicted dinucleotide-binding enzyme